jgi:hypothetical protein
MKNYLNKLFRPQFSYTSFDNVYKTLRTDLHKAQLTFNIDKEILDIIVLKSLEEVIYQRNLDSNKQNSKVDNKIKLFGENSIFKDNSIWVELNNSNNLYTELLYSKTELFMTINHIFQALGANGCQNELLYISENSNINTIDELKQLVYELTKRDIKT